MALGTFETVIYLMALFVITMRYVLVHVSDHKHMPTLKYSCFYVTFIDDITFYMFIILFVCLYSIKIIFKNKRDALHICIL